MWPCWRACGQARRARVARGLQVQRFRDGNVKFPSHFVRVPNSSPTRRRIVTAVTPLSHAPTYGARMATDLRRDRGALGERIALEHLERRGYRIVDRNFRTRYGELDIVAADRRALVFCEVKTRVAGGRSGPA